MTSPAEYEAALCQLEYDPPDMAYTCRRCLDGSVDNFEPSCRGMEKRSLVKGSSQLSAGANACLSHAQSRVECRGDWSNGLSSNPT